MGFRNPILGGGGALVRPAIKSPNYVPGTSGWMVNRNGNAEFNDLVVRGIFDGTDFVMNDAGLFVYSATPAAGNLVGSIASADGVDTFGNHYVAGVAVYAPGSRYAQLKAGSQQFGPIVGGVPDQVDIALLQGGLAAFTILSPPDAADGWPTALSVDFASGVAGATVPDGSTEPHLRVGSNGSSVASIQVSGALVKNGALGVPVTWMTPTMGTGWATGTGIGGSYPPLRYHLDGEDGVRVFGTYHATSTTPSTIMATGLPGVNQTGLGGVGVGGAAVKMVTGGTPIIPLYLNSAGELRVAAAGGLPTIAVNDTFMVDTTIPLGNIH